MKSTTYKMSYEAPQDQEIMRDYLHKYGRGNHADIRKLKRALRKLAASATSVTNATMGRHLPKHA